MMFIQQGLIYEEVDDYLVCYGFSRGESRTILYIPVSVNEKPVASIGVRAFSGNQKLKTIAAPGITSIEDDAFRGCVNLQTASFSRLKTIGPNAFRGCEKLSVLAANEHARPNELRVRKIAVGAFDKCNSLKKLKISSELQCVEETNWNADEIELSLDTKKEVEQLFAKQAKKIVWFEEDKVDGVV